MIELRLNEKSKTPKNQRESKIDPRRKELIYKDILLLLLI